MSAIVSCVIPVYNVKGYVERCVRSVVSAAECFSSSRVAVQSDVNQPMVEVICVDDGSTDGSGEILDRLAREFSGNRAAMLKIIHQENSGVSVARNVALKIAAGDYLVFVDSDDNVTKGFLLHALEDMKNDSEIDVWVGQRKVVDNDYDLIDASRQPKHIPAMETNAPIKDFLRIDGRYYLYCVWGKVFRRGMFDKFSVHFSPGLDIGEDALLMAEVYARSRKVKVVECEPSYIHCWRGGSLVRRHWADLVPQYFESSRLLEEYAEKNHLEDRLSPLIAQWALSRIRTMLDKGYPYEWMSEYIEALCRHPDFKRRVPRNIFRYAKQPYKAAGLILLIMPTCLAETCFKLMIRFKRR